MRAFCFLSGGDSHGCGAEYGQFVQDLTGISFDLLQVRLFDLFFTVI